MKKLFKNSDTVINIMAILLSVSVFCFIVGIFLPPNEILLLDLLVGGVSFFIFLIWLVSGSDGDATYFYDETL